ncbi:hypothetical protein C487_10917 [Natrinema pallidum DSM 3751]|uniref:Uncharacterized protein n=1 Tax=Natrinema pallidum DSM 3751 TaxID=1227495 RepID=L9YUW0_9EURY|nr:hypothetical protein C487_10917 [Natrinema pallidum DSM 3751]
MAHDVEILVGLLRDDLEFRAVVDRLLLGDEVAVEFAGDGIAAEAGADLVGAVLDRGVRVDFEC